MVVRLEEHNIDEMLALQKECLDNQDPFLPTSYDGYIRAFRFLNFCFGFRDAPDARLGAFLNCSIPTQRSAANLGRGRLPPEELDAVGHMNTLLVRRNCRRHGVGRSLVQASISLLYERGCRHIYVTVSPDNTASLELLRTMDFVPVDTILLQGYDRKLLYKRLE